MYIITVAPYGSPQAHCWRGSEEDFVAEIRQFYSLPKDIGIEEAKEACFQFQLEGHAFEENEVKYFLDNYSGQHYAAILAALTNQLNTIGDMR